MLDCYGLPTEGLLPCQLRISKGHGLPCRCDAVRWLAEPNESAVKQHDVGDSVLCRRTSQMWRRSCQSPETY